jgi:methyl-accepting chemotaxis protein
MLHNIRNRIVVKMILIVSACMALLCGVLVTLSTMEQRKQYLEELKMTGNVVRASIASEQERITKAKDQIKSRPTDYSVSPEAKALQHSIESFLDSGEMTNVYVFYPEIVEKEGKTFLVTLQANQTMYDGGLKPLTEYELTPQFRKAYESALDTGTGMTQAYEDSLGTWVSIIYPIVDGQNRTIAILGVDFEYGTVQAELNRKVRLNVAVGVILGALFILIVSWTVRTMLRPVRELTRLSQQAAAGDLTVSIPVRQQDEVGQLASHYNTMIASIRELIRQIRELGLQVGQASGTLRASADQTAESAKYAASSIEAVAAGAERQLQSVEESSRAMTEMAGGIERIAESAGEAAGASTLAFEQADKGNRDIQSNVARMEAIRHSVERSTTAMSDLNGLTRQIGQITEAISEIAEQTNLLALNAAIEAARAGEHGRGFAVVSGQIRKLAEQSKQSSEQIGGLVRSVQEHTERAVREMLSGSEEVRGLAVIVEGIGTSFREIVRSVESVNRQILEISASSEQMSASTEEVTASIVELSHISQQSASASQSVAASAEEQLASMEEIKASASSLNEMASKLNAMVERFKL